MKPVTLLTGASAGIGTELARVFAAHGHELVLVARRADRLNALADDIAKAGRPRPLVLASDLEQRDAAAKIAAAAGNSLELEPNFVVNNAGFGLMGDAANARPRRAARHDRSQCARAHRIVAHFRRQP